MLARLARREGSEVPADEASSHAAEAITLLGRAASDGFGNALAFHAEDALDPLRGRGDFPLLMMDLEMPTDPFTR